MTFPDGSKRDYPDNCARYVFFCRAVMEAIPYLGFTPDILHANDWQCGLLPVYLRELYHLRPAYRQLATLFTIHNIAYQGVYNHSEYHLTGLHHRLYNQHQMEFYGQFSFLKAGIVFADWVNTVSPTYAQEIRTTYFGCGLEGVLTERRERLSGIVNGVDYDSWNTSTDRHLPAHFSIDTVEGGKATCKRELQAAFQLPQEPRVPILGMIARLVEQKGIDIVIRAFDELIRQPGQLIILGDGDPTYHHQLQVLREKYPARLGLKIGFDETLAHRIEAGSDLYLMPSLFEPSGLNQLYSLRYGTPPIVRATGGLCDTVTDVNEETLAQGTATGFRFQAYTSQALLGTIQRAFDMYHLRPEDFLKLQRIGMQQDWSWDRSAKSYEELYVRLVNERESKKKTSSRDPGI
jgi:starch synthase